LRLSWPYVNPNTNVLIIICIDHSNVHVWHKISNYYLHTKLSFMWKIKVSDLIVVLVRPKTFELFHLQEWVEDYSNALCAAN
jgi:hypothetical protein